jgi:hypothetical protein
MSQVKEKETRIIYKETSTTIAYYGENSNVRYVQYTFENGKLKSSWLLLASSATSLIADFLNQRYIPEAYTSGIGFYKRNNITIGVSVDDTYGLTALYYENTTKNKFQVDYFAKKKELFNSLLAK